jgi:hypothetical protein
LEYRCRSLHETSGDEAVESRLEDVGGDAEGALEVGEAGAPGEQGVTDDQQAPAFAHQLQGARRRAVLSILGPADSLPEVLAS